MSVITKGTLINITQNRTKNPVMLVPLIGSTTKDWKIETTDYADPFRKTRNSNIKINVKRNDGKRTKIKVLVIKEA